MMIKECELCGDEFEAKTHNAKFCCEECKLIKYKRETQKNKKIYIKICTICNNEFETNRKNQRFCKNDHYIKCFICGEEFKLLSYKEGRTKYSCGHSFCVREITRYNKSIKNGDEWKPKSLAGKDKIKSLKNKKCQLCGKEFTPSVINQKFCKEDHKANCEYCDKEFTIQKLNRPEKTCSTDCAVQLSAEKRNEIIYNKICAYCDKNFQSKLSHTLYCEGPHYSTCEVCDEEFIVTDVHRLSRTCSQSCASVLTHTEESKQIRKENSLIKYGTEHPFQAEEVKRKIRLAFGELGEMPGRDTRIGSPRWNQLMKDKYGVENISQLEEIKEKKREIYYERYGVYNPAGMHINNYENWENFNYYLESINLTLDCLELANYFNVAIGSIRNKAYETETTGYIKDFYKYSNPELIIKHMLLSLDLKEGIDFLPHDRRIIGPLELDFYLPNHNIAIEVSPIYTHNSLKGWGGHGEGLSEMYHYDKFRLCNEKDIQLFTLFDWTYVDIFKNTLKDKYNLHEPICINEMKYMSNILLEDNLTVIDNNQYRHNKYNTTVISNENGVLMTAIWLENLNEKTSKLKCLEWNEKHSKPQLLNILLNEYKKTARKYGINQIIIETNSDIENGDVYKREGFQLMKEIKPRINYHNEKYNHHIKSTKLINIRKDILENNGYLPVYDCGHRLWKLIIQFN